jgi:hypothetical protein
MSEPTRPDDRAGLDDDARPDDRAVRRDPHLDGGPLADVVPTGWLKVPGVAPLLVAAGLVGAATVIELLAVTVGSGSVRQPIAWVGAGWLLALVAHGGRPHARLDWGTASLLRVVEYGGVLVLAADADDTGRTLVWTFALLATLAVRHYDIVYRVRLLGSPPPGWLATVTGGWSGRLAVLLLAAALGSVPVAIAVMTVVLAPIIVVEIVVSWTRQVA